MPNNVFNASFLDSPPIRGLVRLELQQEVNKHTLAFLNYDITDKTQYALPLERSPFMAQWGVSPLGVRNFYGYVNHYGSVNSLDEPGKTYTQLVGLGTSMPMNAADSKNWVGYTRSGIAREYAKKYRLRSIIHAHPEVVDNWASGLDTDFVVLQRLADECGYFFWVDGSTLYFLDPKRPFDSASRQQIPQISRGYIRVAEVVGGTNAPRDQGSVRRRVLHGLDATTNEFFTATSGSEDYPTQTLSAPVRTYSEANQVTVSSGQRDDDYYTLTATVEGSANLFPGGLVNFAGNGITNDQAGYWLIRSASHVLTPTDFSTRLVASRGISRKPNLTTPSALRDTRESTSAVVRDGRRWEAQVQEHVNV